MVTMKKSVGEKFFVKESIDIFIEMKLEGNINILSIV